MMKIETTEAKTNVGIDYMPSPARKIISWWVILVIHLVALVCLLTDLIYHSAATPPAPARVQVVIMLLSAAMIALAWSNAGRLVEFTLWVQGVYWSLYLLTEIV